MKFPLRKLSCDEVKRLTENSLIGFTHNVGPATWFLEPVAVYDLTTPSPDVKNYVVCGMNPGGMLGLSLQREIAFARPMFYVLDGHKADHGHQYFLEHFRLLDLGDNAYALLDAVINRLILDRHLIVRGA